MCGMSIMLRCTKSWHPARIDPAGVCEIGQTPHALLSAAIEVLDKPVARMGALHNRYPVDHAAGRSIPLRHQAFGPCALRNMGPQHLTSN